MASFGTEQLHTRLIRAASGLAEKSHGNYRTWRELFVDLVSTSGFPHMLDDVGKQLSDGTTTTFGPESYHPQSYARSVDRHLFTLLRRAYSGEMSDEACLHGKAITPHSGYLAIEFLDRVRRTSERMLEQLALKPSELRLNRGNVPAFLKEAQRLRAAMKIEGLEVDDRLILRRLKAQWTDFYRSQPATGMLTDFNDTFVHTMANCRDQFDIFAHNIQSWLMAESAGRLDLGACSRSADKPKLLTQSGMTDRPDLDSGGEQLDAEEAVSSGGEQLDSEEAVSSSDDENGVTDIYA